MQILNPFEMNDWELNKFLKIIVSVQFALWGLIGLDAIDLQIPILRELVSVLYLFYIPGIIILRIFRLHKLGSIETLLYAIGLSIATLMFIGFFMNTVYPIFGISKPMSTIYSIITISIFLIVSSILCYLMDDYNSSSSYITIERKQIPIVALLILIVCLTIFGTHLVNFYFSNILLMLTIIAISAIVLVIGFEKFIPPKLYPLSLFVISISLLFHNSLISRYIWGWDIQTEYYYSNLVLINSLWNSTLISNVNAMLSIVIIAPLFSNISSMNLIWVFKIVYPFLFSMISLGLYRIFLKQTDEGVAFLSVVYFMSFFSFYAEMPQLARQQIAELFLVLFILLLINTQMTKTHKSMSIKLMYIIFVFSICLSHYGLSYIFMGTLVLVFILIYLDMRFGSKILISPIKSTLILLYITFALSWYMNVTNSSAFKSAVNIGKNIYQNILTDFLNPDAAQGTAIMISPTSSLLHSIGKGIHLFSIFFITIGLMRIVFKRNYMEFKREYVAFSVVTFFILVCAIILPFFASAINTTRLYQISIIILSPLCIIGGIEFFKMFGAIFGKSCAEQNSTKPRKILTIFLIVYLLFNTGWIYEVSKDNPTSMSLSNIDYPMYNEQEVLSAMWLNNKNNEHSMYADEYRFQLLMASNPRLTKVLPMNITEIDSNSYVYFGKYNINSNNIMVIQEEQHYSKKQPYKFVGLIYNNMNKIYQNGCSQIYC